MLLAHDSRPTGWQQPLLPAHARPLPAWLPVRGSLSSHTPRHMMCRSEMNFRLDYFTLQVQGSVESTAATRHSAITALLWKAFCWTVHCFFPARTEHDLVMGFYASLRVYSTFPWCLELCLCIHCIWQTEVRHTRTQAQWRHQCMGRLWSEMDLFSGILTPSLPSSCSDGTFPFSRYKMHHCPT